MYDGSATLQRTAQTRYRDGIDLRTLTGDETFNRRTANFLGLDPGGSDRTLTLLPEGQANGLFQFVEHTGTADNLILQTVTPTTVVTLGPGDSAVLRCNGTIWASTTTRPNGAVIADPGSGNAIAVTESGTVAITTGGAEGRSLADPTFAGQRLSISFDVDGGNLTVTAANNVAQGASTSLLAEDAGDYLALEGVTIAGVLRWRTLANDGWTVS